MSIFLFWIKIINFLWKSLAWKQVGDTNGCLTYTINSSYEDLGSNFEA